MSGSVSGQASSTKDPSQLDLLEKEDVSSASPDYHELLDRGAGEAVYSEVLRTVAAVFRGGPRRQSPEMLIQSSTEFLSTLQKSADALGMELTDEDYHKALRIYVGRIASGVLTERLSHSLDEPVQFSRGGALIASLRGG